MGKARFFLTGSLLFLLVNFYLNFNQPLLLLLNNYLLEAWLVFFSLLILSFAWRYFFWLAIIILAILRFYYFIQPEINLRNNFVYNQVYTFTTKIVDLDKKLTGWQITVKPINLINFTGKILINTELYPEYNYNQLLEITCKLNQPEALVDEYGQIFHYDKYLAKSGIYGTCYRPKVKVVGEVNNLAVKFLRTQQYFWHNLNDYLIEPESSLAKAMLLAKRRELTDNLRLAFSQTGLSHVVAISGLHIAIIVWLLEIFLSNLLFSRSQVFWLILFILAIYLWLIGFPSSAVRASLMVILVLLGPYLGRKTMSVYSLLLAADLLILANPYLLVYDIGWQLSFLAVLGLLLYANWWQKVLRFITNKFKIREMISVTLAAQVFTWPLIVYYFGIFSIIAPLANIIILPLLPAVLVLSIILAIVGNWSLLGVIISWPLFLLLRFIILVSQSLASIPGSYIIVDNFSLLTMIISLIFIFILTFILKPNEDRN